MVPPIRIFIASTPSEWLPARVLEFSIRETTSAAVEISQLHTFNRQIATPVMLKNRPRTPFSFQRFLIPELCGHSGKAIYLDADMQVFRNINELWSMPMAEHDLLTVAENSNGRRGQFSVMLLDCGALRWNIDEIVSLLDSGELNYEQLMYEMRMARQIGHNIPPEWNSLEHYDVERTALLHFTDMNIQPWVSGDNPLESIWMNCLMRAIKDGFISMEELIREVRLSHVRPSLILQLERGISLVRELDKDANLLDSCFITPYKTLKKVGVSPWSSPVRFSKAALSKIVLFLRRRGRLK